MKHVVATDERRTLNIITPGADLALSSGGTGFGCPGIPEAQHGIPPGPWTTLISALSLNNKN